MIKIGFEIPSMDCGLFRPSSHRLTLSPLFALLLPSRQVMRQVAKVGVPRALLPFEAFGGEISSW